MMMPEGTGATLRDLYTMNVVQALILADGGDSSNNEYARRALDISNTILAMRSADKSAFLSKRKGRDEEHD